MSLKSSVPDQDHVSANLDDLTFYVDGFFVSLFLVPLGAALPLMMHFRWEFFVFGLYGVAILGILRFHWGHMPMLQMSELSGGFFNHMIRLNERTSGLVFAERSSLLARAVYVPTGFRDLARERPGYFKALMVHEAVHARYRDYFVLINYLLFIGFLVFFSFIQFQIFSGNLESATAQSPEDRQSYLIVATALVVLASVALFRLRFILMFREYRADRISYRVLGKDYFILLEEIWKKAQLPTRQVLIFRLPSWLTHPSIHRRVEKLRVPKVEWGFFYFNLVFLGLLVGTAGRFLALAVTFDFHDHVLFPLASEFESKRILGLYKEVGFVVLSAIGGVVLWYFLLSAYKSLCRLPTKYLVIGFVVFLTSGLCSSIVLELIIVPRELSLSGWWDVVRILKELLSVWLFWFVLILFIPIEWWKAKSSVQFKATTSFFAMATMMVTIMLAANHPDRYGTVVTEAWPFMIVAYLFGLIIDIFDIGQLREP